MSFVSELEPITVWKHFDKILQIPRGSGNEEEIRQYVISVAHKHHLKYKEDKTGNIVITKPASLDKDNIDITILQSHLDMVNEKNADVVHDFTKDPLIPQRDGDYLKATGTTLGSDNGIGVASALAVLEGTDIIHGPLEILFTVDEETGLTGAGNLKANFLKGRRLINLDSEDEDGLYVGCAGGTGSDILLPLKKIKVSKDTVALKLELTGMRGGHSGIDIRLQRGNANKLLARILHQLLLETNINFRLADFAGGNKHNAITREAFTTVYVPTKAQKRFKAMLREQVKALREEYHVADPNIELKITKEKKGKNSWNNKTTSQVLALLHALPYGVIAMSHDLPGLVETSTNLAIVKPRKKNLYIHCSSRSSVSTALVAVKDQIYAIATAFGAQVKESQVYPGWKPDLKSHVLQVAQEVYHELMGKAPKIKAIHAGIECGIIGERCGGDMDMVSMGPQIEFPHSPDERVKIDSVGNYYKLLTGTLERLTS